MSNLKEVYVAFKEAYPEANFGFSKFAENRPPFWSLVGAKGTHYGCVPNPPKREIDGCRSKTEFELLKHYKIYIVRWKHKDIKYQEQAFSYAFFEILEQRKVHVNTVPVKFCTASIR